MSNLIYYLDIPKNGKDVYGIKDSGMLFDEEAVRESVMNILLTEPGQKMMDPTFGVPLYKYLFVPNDEQIAVLISHEIQHALEKFEPRIRNIEVDAELQEDSNEIIINVYYEIILTAASQNLSVNLEKMR